MKTSTGLTGVASQGTTTRTYLPLANDYTCNLCWTTNNCTSSQTLYSCFLAGEWRTRYISLIKFKNNDNLKFQYLNLVKI